MMGFCHSGVQLHFEVEILLHEAGELCFILHYLFGMELGYIQDFMMIASMVLITLGGALLAL